ncbi:hypothetical protein PspLS_01649 [Pyricularia sp. CBS 133598]|nr:hypothetical protein PspLS_01649 [Pyricularia sp. CBS 133598]
MLFLAQLSIDKLVTKAKKNKSKSTNVATPQDNSSRSRRQSLGPRHHRQQDEDRQFSQANPKMTERHL